jgi:hypothetical protein
MFGANGYRYVPLIPLSPFLPLFFLFVKIIYPVPFSCTDPTPQRARHKQSTAEEPVTARIRRRQEANSEAGPPADPHDGLEAENCLPARDGESASPKALISFRERITLERQRQDDGPSLP